MSDPDSRHRCVDCGALSPETQTPYTLISNEHGWRLSREVDASGKKVLVWRCPKCWTRYRAKRTG